MKRLFLLFIVLALLVVVPFLIWGDRFEGTMTHGNMVDWMRSAGSWAWALGIGLLLIDLFLPIPGTVVMSALGLVYGWFTGGLLSAIGSMAAGILAYWLCRKLGRRAARWLASDEGIAEGEQLFTGETGGWLVALSRWMPVLAEVVACMAGLSRMDFRRFFAALCVGSIPMGFVFAWIGHAGEDTPGTALLLSAVLPPLIWGFFRLIYLRIR
ncbi:MAG: VTT domain-containing protein [Verrucomicrobiales bacterium]|nr:VTT domain-containing protein [Verrucomicrobiales bacterium]